MRLTSQTDFSNFGAPHWDSTTYTYDESNRLRRATTSPTFGAPSSDIEYRYDGLGNLTRQLDHIEAVERTFESDPADLDRLCRVTGPTALTRDDLVDELKLSAEASKGIASSGVTMDNLATARSSALQVSDKSAEGTDGLTTTGPMLTLACWACVRRSRVDDVTGAGVTSGLGGCKSS